MSIYCTQCGTELQSEARFCTQCGTVVGHHEERKSHLKGKREKVLKGTQKHRTNYSKTVVLPVFLIGAAVWIYVNLPESGNPILNAAPVVTTPATYGLADVQMVGITASVEDGYITIPLSVIQEKKFVRFVYGDPTYGLPMLAYISPEGKVVTAVSMCEPCNSTAFHIKTDDLICNSCGTTWEVGNLEAVSGSCGKYPPDVVPNEVSDGNIRIDERYISNWQRRI